MSAAALARRGALVHGLLALLGVLGCARAPAAPADTLTECARALEREDAAAAHRLLSREAQLGITVEQLAARLRSPEGAELRAQLARLAERGRRTREVRIAGVDDEQAVLVLEEGGWRLRDLPDPAFGQRTPAMALRALARALALRRWDVVHRLAPGPVRKGVTPEGLAAHFESPEGQQEVRRLGEIVEELPEHVPEEDDVAYWPYGDGHEVVWVREGTAWCVQAW